MLSKDSATKTGVCTVCGPVAVVLFKGSLRCVNKVRGTRTKPEQLKINQALKAALRDGKPCGICGGEGQVLDHKHGEGTWRGVLCYKHNTGLGLFNDDPELLEAAANYLRTHE